MTTFRVDARCAYQHFDLYADAVGRAVVYVDTHDDQELTTTLRVLRQARGSRVEAVVEARKLRFLDNGITDHDWQVVREHLDGENLGRRRRTNPRRLAPGTGRAGDARWVPRMVLQLGDDEDDEQQVGASWPAGTLNHRALSSVHRV